MTLIYSLLSLGLLIEASCLILITRTDLSEQSGFYLGTFIVLFGLFALASYLVLTNKFVLSPVLKGRGNQPGELDSAPALDSATVPGIEESDRKAALVLIIVFATLFRLAAELSLPRRIMLVFGVTLLVASTVHSSYISWLLIWLPLVWGKGFKSWDKAWLLFALLIQLYYLNYAPKPDFPFKSWINPLEYWPLHLLIGWNIYDLVEKWAGFKNKIGLKGRIIKKWQLRVG